MEVLAPSVMLTEIRSRTRLSQTALAQILGASFVSVDRWERGASEPSPAQREQIRLVYERVLESPNGATRVRPLDSSFRSRGLSRQPTLFDPPPVTVELSENPLPAVFQRLANGSVFHPNSTETLDSMLREHCCAARTVANPPESGMSAGKNTYTYDAHTYHTKVPPQGIAELLLHYLPDGDGLVLDPFAGSGMTGVAARAEGYDSILNELSPAACFIADRFVSSIEPERFAAGVEAVLAATREIRQRLYTTECRECGRSTEILYTVWSYRVVCGACDSEFLLWDHCRSYGERVRDHKILTQFPCPNCSVVLQKSRLRRTVAVPVLLGYKCCQSGQQETTHPLSDADLARLAGIEANPPLRMGYFPQNRLPDGVNLRQPIKHGLDSVDKFYTPRNLAAMSQLWYAIHRIEDVDLAAYLAFVFTSLYQRVTRLSEFRFWGGSGNTARFNVPYISNEANVFLTYERKARTIHDHLRTTAAAYQARSLVVCGSATAMDCLPDDSIDLIFTDPPFGGNINYSEMNILWESWLGQFTDATHEAIVNRVQGKDVDAYRNLMMAGLGECFRVLRPGHWLLLVFMNSAKEIWNALREAITGVGFTIKKIDIFDKQHGTFKQFASENTAGFDLVLHCLKPDAASPPPAAVPVSVSDSVQEFLAGYGSDLPTQVYLHVGRESEVDYRRLYSEWLSDSLLERAELVDFAEFRRVAQRVVLTHQLRLSQKIG